jgi:hypothetical protein
MMTAPETPGPASENLQRRKPREGIRLRVLHALWGLYERGTVKLHFCVLLTFILLFDLKSHSFVPTLASAGARRARSLKDGAIAPPNGLVLD